MILQQHIETKKGYLVPKSTGKPTESLTIPGQGINLKYAMEQYRRGSLIERAIAFYEDEKMPMPDFQNMDRIERLGALAEYRKDVKRLGNILTNDAKLKSDVADKQEKAKQQQSERIQRGEIKQGPSGDSPTK